jgi:hypothetical protein
MVDVTLEIWDHQRLFEGATLLSDDKSTIGYTAPELYDRESNWKVDVFPFAMVLYETRAELPAEM